MVLDGPRSPGLARALAPAAEAAGVRLVAPQRPPGTKIADWPTDHLALLDAFAAPRAGIVSQSGGTPYALAAAAALGDRTTGLALLGAVWAPWERGGKAGLSRDMRVSFALGRRAPGLLRRLLRGVAKDPAKAAARALAQAPAADRKLLEDPALLAIHEESTREILAAPDEIAAEIVQLVRPWPIDLTAVTCPVAFWSGALDSTHPTAMSRRLAAKLGDAPVHVIAGAGTFGLLPAYPEILAFAAGPSGSGPASSWPVQKTTLPADKGA